LIIQHKANSRKLKGANAELNQTIADLVVKHEKATKELERKIASLREESATNAQWAKYNFYMYQHARINATAQIALYAELEKRLLSVTVRANAYSACFDTNLKLVNEMSLLRIKQFDGSSLNTGIALTGIAGFFAGTVMGHNARSAQLTPVIATYQADIATLQDRLFNEKWKVDF
jgi:hypothetical protein